VNRLIGGPVLVGHRSVCAAPEGTLCRADPVVRAHDRWRRRRIRGGEGRAHRSAWRRWPSAGLKRCWSLRVFGGSWRPCRARYPPPRSPARAAVSAARPRDPHPRSDPPWCGWCTRAAGCPWAESGHRDQG